MPGRTHPTSTRRIAMDWTRTIVAGVLLAGGAAAQETSRSSDASSEDARAGELLPNGGRETVRVPWRKDPRDGTTASAPGGGRSRLRRLAAERGVQRVHRSRRVLLGDDDADVGPARAHAGHAQRDLLARERREDRADRL